MTQTERILVALDASPQSLAALEAAAKLANLLRAEICGIYVEDSDLERLCSLPFSAEVGGYSATARALSDFCISREFHALEEEIRLQLQRVAQSCGVPWSLRVARGGVANELLNAAGDATMLSLGRSGWSQRNQLGSTAATVMGQIRQPLLWPGNTPERSANRAVINEIKVVYTGTDAADRALSLAHHLAISSGHPLTVYFITDPLTDSTERNQALENARVVSLRQRGTSFILERLQSSQSGITILADANAYLTVSLFDVVADPILLVS